jgi:alkylation response protein AidB-like acyl-CoA dehydrogenase
MTAASQPTISASPVSSVAPPIASNGVGGQLLDRARAIGAFLREQSDVAERERRLPSAVLKALAEAGFHRMLMPQSLGGLEVDPVTCARVVEAVAGYDSAAGWSLQSANVNAFFSSRLPDEGVDEILGADPNAIVAAAFHPPQQAVQVDGGYRVSGRAPLASMVHDSEWILFGALIMDNGQPRMTPFGPMMIAVVMRTSEIEILDTWYTLGMRGTDSNDAAFRDVFVPARRTFPFNPEFTPGRHFQGPLYQFPAVPVTASFSVGVMMAAARGAIDELKDLAQRKVAMGSMKTLRDRGVVQATLAQAEGTLRSGRALFYEAMSEGWARTVARGGHTMEQRADLLLACVHAGESAVKATTLMHGLAGTTGIYTRSRLDRYFRDVHTLHHHGFVSASKLESVGQVYLGLPPDFGLLPF